MPITADQVIQKMKELYGNKVASPEIFPKVFEFQIKMAIHSINVGL